MPLMRTAKLSWPTVPVSSVKANSSSPKAMPLMQTANSSLQTVLSS